MKGFFSNHELQSKSAKKRISKHPGCAKCQLHKQCNSPRMPMRGKGKKGILLLAEAPGGQEDLRNEQLVGKAGKFLERKLNRLFGIKMNSDCFKINAVNCRPPDNRDPKAFEIEACRPYVLDQIDKVQPHVIIPFGTHSIKCLLGHRWKKDLGSISKWRGWQIPDRDFQAWICPTFHPSYINRKTTPEVAQVIFESDLAKAIECADKGLPSFVSESEEDKVTILKHPDEVDRYLENLLLGPSKIIAFDYETTGLKPHAEGHEIISCAIADSRDSSTAFPIFDENIAKFKRVLASEHLWKVAQGMKFEETWSRVILNARVKPWLFCTQNAMHVHDNRPGVTGLKFQAYVNYGVCDYDSNIEPYIKSKDGTGNGLNRLKELPMSDILLYNGLDALFTYKRADDLMHELGGVIQLENDFPF